MEESQPSTSSNAVDEDPLCTNGGTADDDQLSMSCVVDEDSHCSQSSSSSADDEPRAKRLTTEEVRRMWNLIKIYQQLGTREQAVAFAEEKGMIPRTKMCTYHKREMKISFSTNRTVGTFLCRKGKCDGKYKVTRAKGTWFEEIKIPMPQVFYLMYAYAKKFSYEQTIREDFSETCLSSRTISYWFNSCREVVVKYQKYKQSMKGNIGGAGKVVKVHTSKFAKSKYTKEGQADGHWVLGMLEDGSEDLRIEVCPNNVCSDVLLPLVKNHVAEGTTIITDTSQFYGSLGDHGYIHHTVNQCEENNTDVAKDNTSCALRMQSHPQWRAIQYFFNRYSYYKYRNTSIMEDLIFEHLWRTDVKVIRADPFEELIKAINHSFKNHNPPFLFAGVEK